MALQLRGGLLTASGVSVYDRDNGQAGILAPTGNNHTLTTWAMAANVAYLIRFVPSRSMLITKMAFGVSTASGLDDPVDVGIYNADWTTKLVSSGATSGKLNSQNAQTITITGTQLQAGVVYHAAIATSAVGATLIGATSVSYVANILFGTSAGQMILTSKAASYPLPASLAGAASSTVAPILALRES